MKRPGRGGVRGYWTEGIHWDSVEERYRTARAYDPVPYAGGEVGEYNEDPERMFGAIHNMERPIDGPEGESAWTDSERPRRPDANDGADLGASGYDAGELVYVTDENFTSTSCSTYGKFYIASLAGADQGQAWRTADEYDAGAEPFALDEVSRWSVAEKEGSSDSGTCSAHYFNIQDGVVAGGWYSQGFRFLDVTDPTDPNQIAYFRPEGGSGWSTHWIGEVIYANDSVNGIHILTLNGGAAELVETRSEVLAPPMTATELVAARRADRQLTADPVYGWSCALPADTA